MGCVQSGENASCPGAGGAGGAGDGEAPLAASSSMRDWSWSGKARETLESNIGDEDLDMLLAGYARRRVGRVLFGHSALLPCTPEEVSNFMTKGKGPLPAPEGPEIDLKRGVKEVSLEAVLEAAVAAAGKVYDGQRRKSSGSQDVGDAEAIAHKALRALVGVSASASESEVRAAAAHCRFLQRVHSHSDFYCSDSYYLAVCVTPSIKTLSYAWAGYSEGK